MKYSMGMEVNHLVVLENRPPLYGVGTYDTEFHGLLSWSMSVNAYSHHLRCALWFFEMFYEVWVVIWDAIHALHESTLIGLCEFSKVVMTNE
ncbi:hypothetical protein MTR67_017772 [Solanum verrucosum]|uniref:Uncharacterized protein n=1 Tax=Solanum verrucosum TaxID=315347 RepID=A0AAF0QIJ7_SOLVR|nr:hypothetical protein MTR67_017772 [Solanum verrucosum]